MMKTKMSVLITMGISMAILQPAHGTDNQSIIKIYDGDTVMLSSGEKVRLLQIDTPELSPNECFGQEARKALIDILSGPGKLSLRSDPSLDYVDKYGRLLRYVFKGKMNVNLKLVEVGAAAPYFYRGERGVHSKSLLNSAQEAKRKSLGLWKKCPGTVLTPDSALATKSKMKTMPSKTSTDCNPNYKGCVPNSSSDLDCSDIKNLGLAPVEVIGTDVYRLDRDGDGIGCAS